MSRTRPRRDWTDERWQRHRAGLKRLNDAFGHSGGTSSSRGLSPLRKLNLLERLGLAKPPTAGKVPEISVPRSATDPRIVVPGSPLQRKGKP